jgi:predicted  nucleic acid-binding Zn-ribbon protein
MSRRSKSKSSRKHKVSQNVIDCSTTIPKTEAECRRERMAAAAEARCGILRTSRSSLHRHVNNADSSDTVMMSVNGIEENNVSESSSESLHFAVSRSLPGLVPASPPPLEQPSQRLSSTHTRAAARHSPQRMVILDSDEDDADVGSTQSAILSTRSRSFGASSSNQARCHQNTAQTSRVQSAIVNVKPEPVPTVRLNKPERNTARATASSPSISMSIPTRAKSEYELDLQLQEEEEEAEAEAEAEEQEEQEEDPEDWTFVYDMLPTCIACKRNLGSNVHFLHCGHLFHAHCMPRHGGASSTCPKCNHESPPRKLVSFNFMRMVRHGVDVLISKHLSEQEDSKLLVRIDGIDPVHPPSIQTVLNEIGRVRRDAARFNKTLKELKSAVTPLHKRSKKLTKSINKCQAELVALHARRDSLTSQLSGLKMQQQYAARQVQNSPYVHEDMPSPQSYSDVHRLLRDEALQVLRKFQSMQNRGNAKESSRRQHMMRMEALASLNESAKSDKRAAEDEYARLKHEYSAIRQSVRAIRKKLGSIASKPHQHRGDAVADHKMLSTASVCARESKASVFVDRDSAQLPLDGQAPHCTTSAGLPATPSLPTTSAATRKKSTRVSHTSAQRTRRPTSSVLQSLQSDNPFATGSSLRNSTRPASTAVKRASSNGRDRLVDIAARKRKARSTVIRDAPTSSAVSTSYRGHVPFPRREQLRTPAIAQGNVIRSGYDGTGKRVHIPVTRALSASSASTSNRSRTRPRMRVPKKVAKSSKSGQKSMLNFFKKN